MQHLCSLSVLVTQLKYRIRIFCGIEGNCTWSRLPRVAGRSACGARTFWVTSLLRRVSYKRVCSGKRKRWL